MKNVKQMDKQFVANTYARFDVAFESGKGSILKSNGKKYIDFGSGIAVSSFGVSDKKWVSAVTKQAKTLSHTSNLYFQEPCVSLAKMLCEKTGMKKVFFSNSGAEANECAIKTARKYSFDKYGEDRFEIVTLKNSFHGRTMATLSATGQESFHQKFNPFLQGFCFVEANNIEDLKSKVTNKTCAIMFEFVQGEGGINCLNKDFVEAIFEIAKEKDLLTIADEVQTGNGRTGKLYAFMNYAVKPDIVTTAKGLAGGLPLGATMFGEKVENTLDAGSHGSTFGGNPICCQGAISILQRLDDEFLSNVEEKANYIREELGEIDEIKNISGLGLMIGFETEHNAKTVANECLKKGLLVLTAKNKIRLLPALNIAKKEIDCGIKILKEVLDGTFA